MKSKSPSLNTPSTSNQSTGEDVSFPEKKALNRRSFLKSSVVAGAAVTAGAAILENAPSALAQSSNGHLTRGDAAILRWFSRSRNYRERSVAAVSGTRRHPRQRSVNHSQSADSRVSLKSHRRQQSIYQRRFAT